MDKKSIVNNFIVNKNILKIAPPSIQKLDLEDTRKLVTIVAALEMMREYLIKDPTRAH